jgi:hypothetical protein
MQILAVHPPPALLDGKRTQHPSDVTPRFMKTRKKILLAAASILLPCLFFGFGFVAPSTTAGYFTFYTFYLLPPTRPAFLHLYSRILLQRGGFLPTRVDEFLAARLTQPESSEWRGILAFYIQQNSGRWGDACGHLPESLKPVIVQHLLSTIDADSPETQITKLIFIEYLRRDGDLYKGGFVGGAMEHWDEQQGVIYEPAKIQQVIAAYRTWFSPSSSWSAIRASDPLAGTGMSIQGI